MRHITQRGRSLFAAVGIFLLISFVCGFLISRYTQIRHHNKMVEINDTMYTLFERYQAQMPVFLKERSNLHGAISIQSHNLIDQCHVKPSMFNKNEKVCDVVLGEIDVKTTYAVSKLYNYIYVHFTDMYKKNSCREFLSAGWQNVLPKSFWGNEGYIGVISENTKGKIYFSYNENYIKNDGAQINPTRVHLKDVCRACKNSRYCSILFFFVTDENSLHNI